LVVQNKIISHITQPCVTRNAIAASKKTKNCKVQQAKYHI
jgi:hypothetical protein